MVANSNIYPSISQSAKINKSPVSLMLFGVCTVESSFFLLFFFFEIQGRDSSVSAQDDSSLGIRSKQSCESNHVG